VGGAGGCYAATDFIGFLPALSPQNQVGLDADLGLGGTCLGLRRNSQSGCRKIKSI